MPNLSREEKRARKEFLEKHSEGPSAKQGDGSGSNRQGDNVEFDEFQQTLKFAQKKKRAKRTWEEFYQAVKAYKEQYGDCNVPRRYEPDPPLGAWVGHQRRDKHKLTAEQKELLQALDFDLETRQERDRRLWNEKFERLRAFQQEHGHCRVTGQGGLGTWASHQRELHHKGKLTTDQQEKLNSIGFELEAAGNVTATKKAKSFNNAKSDEKWLSQYRKLVEFHKEFGHCLVPFAYEKDKSLGNWVTSQRVAYREGDLPADRTQLLSSLQFVWKIDHGMAQSSLYQKRWEEYFTQLVEFKKEHGHFDVPPLFVKGNLSLGKWLEEQRKSGRKGALDPRRAQKLIGIGVSWGKRLDQRWEDKYAKLRAFYMQHGHCSVPRDSDLSGWVQHQRNARDKGTLFPERKRRLDAIGFTWKGGSTTGKAGVVASSGGASENSGAEGGTAGEESDVAGGSDKGAEKVDIYSELKPLTPEERAAEAKRKREAAGTEEEDGKPPAKKVRTQATTDTSTDREDPVVDGLKYLDRVKAELGEQPHVLKEFLGIIKNIQSQQVDMLGSIMRVSTLFKGNRTLILGFNTFLPFGYAIELPRGGSDKQPAEGASLVVYKTPEDTVTHVLEVPPTVEAKVSAHARPQHPYMHWPPPHYPWPPIPLHLPQPPQSSTDAAAGTEKKNEAVEKSATAPAAAKAVADVVRSGSAPPEDARDQNASLPQASVGKKDKSGSPTEPPDVVTLNDGGFPLLPEAATRKANSQTADNPDHKKARVDVGDDANEKNSQQPKPQHHSYPYPYYPYPPPNAAGGQKGKGSRSSSPNQQPPAWYGYPPTYTAPGQAQQKSGQPAPYPYGYPYYYGYPPPSQQPKKDSGEKSSGEGKANTDGSSPQVVDLTTASTPSVAAIKERLSNEQPETQQKFMDIIQRYQRGIKEALNEASAVCGENSDLFRQFANLLPDAVQEQAKEHDQSTKRQGKAAD